MNTFKVVKDEPCFNGVKYGGWKLEDDAQYFSAPRDYRTQSVSIHKVMTFVLSVYNAIQVNNFIILKNENIQTSRGSICFGWRICLQ